MVAAVFPLPEGRTHTLGCWRAACSLTSAVSPSPRLKKPPCPGPCRLLEQPTPASGGSPLQPSSEPLRRVTPAPELPVGSAEASVGLPL